MPGVLSVDEVTLLLGAATAPKYKAAFATAYGAGLRVSEVVALKVGDIDSKRMLLRVERGKGGKDRHAMLSPQLLELLRVWWREGRRRSLLLPGGWLFPGGNPVEPLSARQFCRAVHAAAQAAGIKKHVSPHTLRHSFATHLLEQGVDIRVIQTLLGHAKLDTTALYTRVANTTIRAVTSPLDRLAPLMEHRPQPPLPQVPGCGGAGLPRGPRGRSAAGRLFPRRLHPAGRDRLDRLPEQGRGLRPVVPHGRRDTVDDRRRSQTPRCSHRRHRRAAQLGLSNDPPSARPHDRAGRRDLA